MPHLRAARRGVSVATTGTLSRVLGARTGAGQRLASERAAALSPEKSGGNRAGSLGVRVGNERQRPRLAAPRWQQPHLRSGGGRHCGPRWGQAARAPAKRIAWWERRGSGGLREQEASRRSGVQLPAAICASTRRGQRERNGKGEGLTLWLSAKAWGMRGNLGHFFTVLARKGKKIRRRRRRPEAGKRWEGKRRNREEEGRSR